MKSESSNVKFSIGRIRSAHVGSAVVVPVQRGDRPASARLGASLPAVPSAPFLVAQISDPHIGADWDGEDPIAALREVVVAVVALPSRPDAVLVTGDLTENGGPAEYATVQELLDPVGAPVHAIGGNHDDRATLRAAFGLPGQDAAPVQWAVDLGPLRLIGLDTNIPGRAGGALDGERLRWLDTELARAPDQPTLLAMHHPPIDHRGGAVGCRSASHRATRLRWRVSLTAIPRCGAWCPGTCTR